MIKFYTDDADFVEDEWDDYVADNIGYQVVNEIGMLKLREQVFEIDCGGNNFVIHSSFDLTPTIVRYDNVSISHCGYIIRGGGMEPITTSDYSCVGSCDNIDKFLSHLRQTQG